MLLRSFRARDARRALAGFVLLCLLPLFTACAGTGQTVGALIAYRDVPIGETRVEADQAYREGAAFVHEKQRLDLFLPATPSEGWPTLVFVHGGGWTTGDRKLGALGVRPIQNLARFYADRGFAVAVPSYRLQPDVDWRTQVEDVAGAVAWTRREVAARGGDPDAIFLGGHSAGAHLSAWVGLAEAPLAAEGLDRASLCGLVLVSGAGYALDDEATYEAGSSPAYFEQRFGDPADPDWAQTASIRHQLAATAPPALLLTAEGEGPTFERQSNVLYEGVAERAPGSRREVVDGQNHQRILIGMSLEGDPVSETVLSFLNAQQCQGG